MVDENLNKLEQKQEPVIKLELNVQEINVILGALQELPHRTVDVLLKKIVSQAQSQVQQQAPVPTPTAE